MQIDQDRAMVFSLMSVEEVEMDLNEKVARELADADLAHQMHAEMNDLEVARMHAEMEDLEVATRLNQEGEIEEKLVRQVQEQSFADDKPRQNPVAASDAKFILVECGADEVCTICQDSMRGCKVALLGCDHSFHRECLLRSFDFDNRCPNCQAPVTQGVAVCWGLMNQGKFAQLVHKYNYVCCMLLVGAHQVLADEKVAAELWAAFVEKRIVTSYHSSRIYIWAKSERECQRSARAGADILKAAGIHSRDRVVLSEIHFQGKLADLRCKTVVDASSKPARKRSSRSLSP